MKLYFKQRLFSWFDSYDIYDETGATAFTVRGQLSWGHCLQIYDAQERNIGTVREVVLSFLPRFELSSYGRSIGTLRKEFSLLRPRYQLDLNGWQIEGNWLEWDYSIVGADGRAVASISKQLLRMTDTYVIDLENPADALCALMVVLAIDAEKCSRD